VECRKAEWRKKAEHSAPPFLLLNFQIRSDDPACISTIARMLWVKREAYGTTRLPVANCTINTITAATNSSHNHAPI
jgi:hypothetical protein